MTQQLHWQNGFSSVPVAKPGTDSKSEADVCDDRVQAHAPTLAAREAETRPADSASTRPSRAGKAKTQKGTLDRGQPGTERRMGRWSPDKAISHNTTE